MVVQRKILVSGGAGYVGSVLVPMLVKEGHTVHVLDTFWFWDSPEEYLEAIGLSDSAEIKVFKGDLRTVEDIQESLEGVDTVIQLACVSNDPSSDLDAKFTHSVNYDGNINIIDEAKRLGVQDFIFASSSSVYGIKEIPDVTEDVLLEPITQYSKLKVEVEHYLLHVIDDNFRGVIVRPATVCGYSPRQRLDVIVNILVNSALSKGVIKVFGGAQLRPNIHILDMCGLYIHLLSKDFAKLNGETFNAGWENLSVQEIADRVHKIIPEASLEVVPTNDNRTYHVSSQKIRDVLGFEPEKTVEMAATDLKNAIEDGQLGDTSKDRYYNIKQMQLFLDANSN